MSTIESMPLLKRFLADQGTTFANFFVTHPLCCPSRATFLRGQYPHNHQVLTNGSPSGGFRRFRRLGHESSTVATWLQEAGYRTALLGKYLNGYPSGESTHIPQGWNEWYAVTDGHYYEYQLNENGELVDYGEASEDYETDVLARKAIDFMRRAAADREPFFAFITPFAPHLPVRAADRHRHMFTDVSAPRPPSFDEKDVSDKPQWLRETPLLGPADFELIDMNYRAKLRSLQAVDEMVASIVEALRAMGQLNNTFIIYTSDNGYHLGEHRLPDGKDTPYEHDIRVPLIVRGPGVPSGRVVEHLALNNDIGPTIAELARARAPDFVDGRSLAPLLSRDPPSLDGWRQSFIVEHWMRRMQEETVADFKALRAREYVYIEWHTGERELYHLPTDPHQLESLHARADPAFLAQLSERLKELSLCAQAACRQAEDALVPALAPEVIGVPTR